MVSVSKDIKVGFVFREGGGGGGGIAAVRSEPRIDARAARADALELALGGVVGVVIGGTEGAVEGGVAIGFE